jgi:hypothetical protein
VTPEVRFGRAASSSEPSRERLHSSRYRSSDPPDPLGAGRRLGRLGPRPAANHGRSGRGDCSPERSGSRECGLRVPRPGLSLPSRTRARAAGERTAGDRATRYGMAQRLHWSPRWLQSLGLSAAPSALSSVPRSRRPLIDLQLAGREEDLEWLRSTPGDLIIAGEPGSGKTFLLLHWIREGWNGLFLVDKDPGRDQASAPRAATRRGDRRRRPLAPGGSRDAPAPPRGDGGRVLSGGDHLDLGMGPRGGRRGPSGRRGAQAAPVTTSPDPGNL